jgi:hypothetical protein
MKSLMDLPMRRLRLGPRKARWLQDACMDNSLPGNTLLGGKTCTGSGLGNLLTHVQPSSMAAPTARSS